MKNKRNVLYSLAIMLAGVIYFPAQAQQRNVTHRANFSGEWKLNESKSARGGFLCIYDPNDRMRNETMKIAEQANFLTVEVPNSSPDAAPVKGQEKLTFDGKEIEVNYTGGRGKKYTVKLSADGQTMTVNTIVNMPVTTPFNVYPQKQESIKVTEVWKLSNDGKSISIQGNAKSNLSGGERYFKHVYDKAS